MMSDNNPPNKAVNLELMKKKLEAMLSKSKEELHSLEVEWLHLRSLALRDEHKPTKNKLKTILEPIETNFDDINEINAQDFNLNTSELKYTTKPNNNTCESESEEDL